MTLGIYPLVNCHIAMENHHFSWENPLFLWPFSIAMVVHQRVPLLCLPFPEFDWFSRVNHPVSKYILRREHGFLFNAILLVGGLEHVFYFSIYWECHHHIIPTDEFIVFGGVGIPTRWGFTFFFKKNSGLMERRWMNQCPTLGWQRVFITMEIIVLFYDS